VGGMCWPGTSAGRRRGGDDGARRAFWGLGRQPAAHHQSRPGRHARL